MSRNTAGILVLTSLLATWGSSASAQGRPNGSATPVDRPPGAQVLLSVSGLDASPRPSQLSLQDLRAFPETSLTCLDPWTRDAHTFTGVSLARLLESLGMRREAKGIEVVAENGYAVGIRRADLDRLGYVLAYGMDGALLRDRDRVRNRGALVIAFDLASHHEVNASVYRYQFVYQVRTIHVR
jgi:hypothetical protein